MRTILLIAAGLAGLVGASPARAQYYGYGPYVPYYAYPYGYYPPPYYYPPPPAVIYVPRPIYRPQVVRPRQARHVYRRVSRSPIRRASPSHLINPLLGPLPGARGRY